MSIDLPNRSSLDRPTHPSIHLFIHQPIHRPSIYPSIHLSAIHRPTHPSVHLSPFFEAWIQRTHLELHNATNRWCSADREGSRRLVVHPWNLSRPVRAHGQEVISVEERVVVEPIFPLQANVSAEVSLPAMVGQWIRWDDLNRILKKNKHRKYRNSYSGCYYCGNNCMVQITHIMYHSFKSKKWMDMNWKKCRNTGNWDSYKGSCS